MAAWEDAFDSLGPQGKQIKADFKTAFKSIKGDMSTFLVAEADRVKSWLELFDQHEISNHTLGTLMDNEKLLIQQHVLQNTAASVAATEKAAGKLLNAAIDKLIDHVL
jgi:hypothetical protein